VTDEMTRSQGRDVPAPLAGGTPFLEGALSLSYGLGWEAARTFNAGTRARMLLFRFFILVGDSANIRT
jgi:hypothetical protein